jgi:superfamily II DNA or RNA helicase
MILMQALKLRPYQREAIDAVHGEWAKGINRTACVLPTGLGKTVVFAHLIAENAARGVRTLVLVHREELAEQAKAKLHSVAPHLSVGIVKAARNEVDRDVVIASVQTLARAPRRLALYGIGMIVVDECHHAVARTWIEVLTHFGAFGDEREGGDNATPTVGFTATLTRDDGKGLADVWESVAYERDIMYGIERGYLCDVRGQMVTVDGFDLATIARSRGDYAEGALGDALEASGAGEVIAEAYNEHAKGKRGILFAPTVSSAEAFADDLIAAGIPTEIVTGETTTEDRALMYKRFAHGDTQVLANCMVLTEGFDAPHAEVCVIARPTQSAALYTQMVGRVLRPFPGKDDALVLDVVGISGRMKLRSLTDLVGTEVRDGETTAGARERLEKEARDRGERVKIAGTRASQVVELFANSHSAWLKTYAGTYFIPVKGGQVVIFENTDGTWRVGRKMDRKPGVWEANGLTLEYAMAHGENIADEIDPSVSSKASSWRRTKPSDAQVGLALKLKLAPADEIVAMRKGALSDLISIHIASRALDPKSVTR